VEGNRAVYGGWNPVVVEVRRESVSSRRSERVLGEDVAVPLPTHDEPVYPQSILDILADIRLTVGELALQANELHGKRPFPRLSPRMGIFPFYHSLPRFSNSGVRLSRCAPQDVC